LETCTHRKVLTTSTKSENSASVRKNLAGHVSLSSILHNVKEQTQQPFRSQRPKEQTLRILNLSETRVSFRLPGRSSALRDFLSISGKHRGASRRRQAGL